jgi:hypothetical protein
LGRVLAAPAGGGSEEEGMGMHPCATKQHDEKDRRRHQKREEGHRQSGGVSPCRDLATHTTHFDKTVFLKTHFHFFYGEQRTLKIESQARIVFLKFLFLNEWSQYNIHRVAQHETTVSRLTHLPFF